MQFIGKLDREKFKVITTTDEVILTSKQVLHIKERHPHNYEKYFKYFKEIVEKNKKFQLILRLHTSKNNENYKNSIITFFKISESKYNQYLRNKEIL